ncbi:universal stress protein, partial [Listeria welshimeri]|nr:universal stress protein [Listeria welshimeri]
VLVGSTGLTPSEQLILGSVTEFVAKHADCDVIVVRGKPWNTKKDV